MRSTAVIYTFNDLYNFFFFFIIIFVFIQVFCFSLTWTSTYIAYPSLPHRSIRIQTKNMNSQRIWLFYDLLSCGRFLTIFYDWLRHVEWNARWRKMAHNVLVCPKWKIVNKFFDAICNASQILPLYHSVQFNVILSDVQFIFTCGLLIIIFFPYTDAHALSNLHIRSLNA